MHKIDKYTYKFNHSHTMYEKSRYIKKMAEKIGEQLDIMNGGDSNESGIIDGNLKSLFDYIQAQIPDIILEGNNTKNKYLVILYGPPSSGKNIARKIACNKIKTVFDEKISLNNIFDSFIDSGVDDIIYQYKKSSSDLKVSKKLKDIFDDFAKDSNQENISEEFIKTNIAKIAEQSYRVYSKNKKKSDAVSEVIKFLSIFLNLNLFIETASWNSEYWNNFLSLLSYYNYIPIVIYPFTDQSDLLFHRNIKRGMKEYRFLQNEGNYGIKKIAENAKDKFKNVIKDIKSIYIENSYLLVYDTDLDDTAFDNIKNMMFTSDTQITEIYSLTTKITGNISFVDKQIK
jgi:hypothetical protein